MSVSRSPEGLYQVAQGFIQKTTAESVHVFFISLNSYEMPCRLILNFLSVWPYNI